MGTIALTVNLSVEDIARSIIKLKKRDKEHLLMLLAKRDKELLKRINEIKTHKVRTLSREEVLKDVL